MLVDTNVFINALVGRGPPILRSFLEDLPRLFVAAPTRAELAGKAARVMACGGRRIATAFDRVELIGDALTAIVAGQARMTVVTEERDFEVLAQLLPGLEVLFYARPGKV